MVGGVTCGGCGSAIASNRAGSVVCAHCGVVVDVGGVARSVAQWQTVPHLRVPPVMAPGDALAYVIRSRGYVETADCGCDQRRQEMNRSGAAVCLGQRNGIVEWLCDAAEKSSWGGWLASKIAPGMVRAEAENLFDEALELAGIVQSHRVAIVTTHWNPAGFARPGDTLRRWLPTVPWPVQVFEVVYPDRYAEIRGSTQIRANDTGILWQKERLINRSVELLPSSVWWVAWVDHDLVFDDRTWVEQAVRMMRGGMDVVQLFDRVRYLDRDETTITGETMSAAATLAVGGVPSAAPGGAWMASARWLRSVGGLYDRNVCGGGDATFFDAVTGHRSGYVERQAPRLRDDSIEYCRRMGGARWGCRPGGVMHLWHGDRENRQYHSRDEILVRHNFDPARHVRVHRSGLLVWTDDAPAELRAEVGDYFTNRREDG